MKNPLTVRTISAEQPLLFKALASAVLAAGVWALSAGATTAQAQNVYWSIGVHSPGVAVGVANTPPVVYHHAPPVVYHRPPPVVYQAVPQVVYQAPVVVQSPVRVQPGWQERRQPPGRGQHRGWHQERGWKGDRGGHGHGHH